jgi:hypothetical protein
MGIKIEKKFSQKDNQDTGNNINFIFAGTQTYRSLIKTFGSHHSKTTNTLPSQKAE